MRHALKRRWGVSALSIQGPSTAAPAGAVGSRATMSSVNLKSYQFRLEREKTWRELAVLVGRAEAGGIKSLTPDELFRLPSLYRATVSSLSVARSISLDQNVILYLESLAARAYFIVYGGHGSLSDGVAAFFSSRFRKPCAPPNGISLPRRFSCLWVLSPGCL